MRLFLVTCFSVCLLLVSCKKTNDEQAIVHIKKGTNYLNNKNYQSALIEFKDALKYDLDAETKVINYRNIAVSFLYVELEDSANYYSKLGMESAEKNTFYYYLNQAEHLLLSKKVDEAIQTFKKAAAVRPNEMEIYNNLSLIYAGNYGEKHINLDKALSNAIKAYELKNNEINQEQLASVYFQRENFIKSGALFLDLSDKHPESKIYQFYYGQCLYFQGKENKGIELMKDAADRDEKCRVLFEELTS
jgi:tetratricopeptide (TPR) repeat protein